MIRVRDDDVLVPSSGHRGKEEDRFKRVHSIIVNGGAIHVPTILGKTIQQFPATIEFIRQETETGRMLPEIHGWEHVDYAKLSEREIVLDLERCVELIETKFDYQPTKFYTPWGANAPHIYEAAREFDLEVVDCSQVIYCRNVNTDPEKYRGKDIELFIHWWQGIRRLESALALLNDTLRTPA